MPIRNIALPFRELPIPIGTNAGVGGTVAPHWSTLGGTIAAANIAAWTPKGATSLASSYVQYGSLGTGLVVGIAPTLSNGWLFNGSTQYLDSGITPVNTQVQSVAVRFSGIAVTLFYQEIFGSRTADPGRALEMTVGTSGDDSTYYSNGDKLGKIGAITSGIVIIAGNTVYLNGVSQGTCGAWTGTSLYTIYLGAMNNAGTAGSFGGITMAAFAYYNIALSAPQVALLNTALGAL